MRVQRSHLLFWLKESFPIFLIVYDAVREAAFWLYIQRDVSGGKVFGLSRTENTMTLHVPVANILDETAMRRLGRFKAKWDQTQKR